LNPQLERLVHLARNLRSHTWREAAARPDRRRDLVPEDYDSQWARDFAAVVSVVASEGPETGHFPN